MRLLEYWERCKRICLVYLTTCIQTGTILIPDFVTAMLNLMTGMGLLGVAAVVRLLKITIRRAFSVFYFERRWSALWLNQFCQ
jgi:hypothetical protein